MAVVDLYDPDTYVEAPPHEVFEELRRTQPVYWQDMPGEPGYWAVLKHADVVHVAREPHAVLGVRGRRGARGPRARAARDDAQHAAGDGPAAPRRLPPARRAAFKARVIAGLEDRDPRRSAARSWPTAAEQGDVEFVHDVTSSLPTRVIGQLMGLPEADLPRSTGWPS